MKIAVPITQDKMIDGHFGHCEAYGVYTISENKKIADFKTVGSPEGCGCKSDIASVLAADGVTLMLAGGIGGGAVNVLSQNGIQVIRGCSGKADEIVLQYLAGKISDSGSSCSTHEHHHHDHDHHHHHSN